MTDAPLIDTFARRIDYVRLSVTDRCDLRCTYCMPERMVFRPREELLSIAELEQLASAFVARGIRRIRLTGGEPLVRRGVMQLVETLGVMVGGGLDELTLTTNGMQLVRHAKGLYAAGVRRVNVSLDTIDAAIFAQIARRDGLAQVLGGIDAAQAAGLRVKINVVAQRDVNTAQLPGLIAWAHGRGCDVTLIEAMPMGTVDHARAERFVGLAELRDTVLSHLTLEPIAYRTSGPARYFRVAETGGRLGMITPLSDNFCAGCNRIRVSATGQLYPCLGGIRAVDLRAALRGDDPEKQLACGIDQAMATKPERHDFFIGAEAERGPARHMSVTGG